MKCFNCQKEILDGSMYCSFCGKPTSIVPDYSIYDDDDINVLLEGTEEERAKKEQEEALKKEEQRKLAEQKKIAYEQRKEELRKEKELERKKKQKTRLTVSIVAVVCVFLIVVGVYAKITIDNNNASSYSYQMKQAENAVKKMDYDTAILHYKRAIQIDSSNLTARLALVDLYFEMEKEDKAEDLLLETIQNDKSAYDAYKDLIAYYEKQEDTDAILGLLKGVTNDRVKTLFKNYMVESPKIHKAGGTYTNSVRVTVSGNLNNTIYYTIDGTDPVQYGIPYSGAIVINQKGSCTLKAVAKNEKGVFSEVVSEKYVIQIEVPADPVISNAETGEIIDGGVFTKETYLSIYIPSGCKAYFTWDKTDPSTENGTEYTEPIVVLEGNHILSVIIIDEENEQSSVIFRGRFEYYPQEETEE